jgi:hydroxyquinol 1,2-dioxygenase
MGMKRRVVTRREAVENCIAKGLLLSAMPMTQSQLFAFWQQGESRKATPAEVLGPFYMKGAPNTKALRAPGAPGFPLLVSGKVLNTRGQLVEGARVELWHADHVGHYDVQGYSYRAKLEPNAKGEYAVDTIMPGHYSDRPAQHIHYLIAAPGHKTLITQVYFATDPFFDGDPDRNYKKNGIVGNRELVLPVKLFEGPGAPSAAIQFDIVLEKA